MYDYDLIQTDVAEPTLCSALKSRLEKYLGKAHIYDYYVDLEYNRNNGKIKTIIDNDFAIIKIKCDFILHSRGHNLKQYNLLALEMKKSYRSQEEKDSDRKRLIALTKVLTITIFGVMTVKLFPNMFADILSVFIMKLIGKRKSVL